MLLADSHITMVVGIDVHATTVPPFNPFHPYIGIVLDPADYIPFLGTNVSVNGLKRGLSDTGGMIIPLMHIPLAGSFAMASVIGHESMNFFASQTVFCDGTRMSLKGYMVMTCNDIGIPLSAGFGKGKAGKTKPVPTGKPVMVGGSESLVSYTYDASSKTGITDTMGKITEILYSDHLMTENTDRNGDTYSWEYDGKGRCVHTYGKDGMMEGRIEYHPDEGYNLVTGGTTTYRYTLEQLVTAEIDPLGNETRHSYTDFIESYCAIDPEGGVTGYSYDGMGNLTGITYPDGCGECSSLMLRDGLPYT